VTVTVTPVDDSDDHTIMGLPILSASGDALLSLEDAWCDSEYARRSLLQVAMKVRPSDAAASDSVTPSRSLTGS
jgi:hypothetical protein